MRNLITDVIEDENKSKTEELKERFERARFNNMNRHERRAHLALKRKYARELLRRQRRDEESKKFRSG